METMRVSVDRITCHFPNTGFTVFRDNTRKATIVGNFPKIYEKSIYHVEGDWVDSSYGKQFSVKRYKEEIPFTPAGMISFLSGGLIKGIGKVYAERIVDYFKDETFEVIEHHPELLTQVEGIGEKRAEDICSSYQEQIAIKDLAAFLQEFGVTPNLVVKIYDTYKEKAVEIIKDNPYRIAEDIWGVGFLTADRIAISMGIELDSEIRITSGIRYALQKLSEEGHTHTIKSQLIAKCAELLGIDDTKIDDCLIELIKNKKVILKEDRIYLPQLLHAEQNVAERLIAINECKKKPVVLDPNIKFDTEYNSTQLLAIKKALEEKVLILTGGPGTGKTTTLNGIIKAFESNGLCVELCAPTGMAAKRMAQSTARTAKTIHRLLEFGYYINEQKEECFGFKKDEEDPLDCDVVIVDETSMVDINLMSALLSATPDKATVIFIGDKDQLPSVGPGNVLKDIIGSNMFNVITLSRIYRQGKESYIVRNAHDINDGKMPILSNPDGTDFYFEAQTDLSIMAERIAQLVEDELPKKLNVKPADIQVLTPMSKTDVGTVALNKLLQERLNKSTDFIVYGERLYKLNDKVMQIRNNYKKMVFNGDIGFVTNINLFMDTITVEFDGRNIEYKRSELEELMLAYAITIHKSQGSEYPVVVMPVTTSHYIMLQRKLLYTGVTRAKKYLYTLGNEEAFTTAVKNISNKNVRNTYLKEEIQNKYIASKSIF